MNSPKRKDMTAKPKRKRAPLPVTHKAPAEGKYLTQCCFKNPRIELPDTDRITSNVDLVTCKGPEQKKGTE